VRTIPQKELRNQVGEVLRQAEAGEEFTITVSGRPVAHLGPAQRQSWVPAAQLRDLWELAPDPALADALADFDYDLRDPWDAAPPA
jgi:prevent-host-death family protein